MTIDIGTTLLSANSLNTALKVTSNDRVVLDFNSNNSVLRPIRSWFVAMGSTSSWQNFVPAAWNDIVYDVKTVDNMGDYSPLTGRFTAPQTGTYYFEAHVYMYKNPTTSADSYTHPLFRVNDSFTARQATSTTPYRIRSRTNSAGAYAADTQINDIFYLTAGDYVTNTIYASAALQWYPSQSLFSGFFIG